MRLRLSETYGMGFLMKETPGTFLVYEGGIFKILTVDNKYIPDTFIQMFECQTCGLLKTIQAKINVEGKSIDIPQTYTKCQCDK